MMACFMAFKGVVLVVGKAGVKPFFFVSLQFTHLLTLFHQPRFPNPRLLRKSHTAISVLAGLHPAVVIWLSS